MSRKLKSSLVWPPLCFKTHAQHQKHINDVVTAVENSDVSFRYFANLPEDSAYRRNGIDEAENLVYAARRILNMFNRVES